MPFIVLEERPDRMGANITWYIMQIIYAHKNEYFIHFRGSRYIQSIFMQVIERFTSIYNHELGEQKGSHDHLWTEYVIENSEQDWPGNNMKVCKAVGCDLVSYFYRNLLPRFRAILNDIIYDIYPMFRSIDVNFKKTIAVHLRLDDIVNRMPYSGIHSTEYYREKLNRDQINIDLEDERLFFEKRGIAVPGWGREYNPYDCQAPIPENIVQKYIDQAKEKYPDHEVVIVTSPISKHTLPYRTMSGNPDIDLLVMANADVLILSKSSFSFVSLYFSEATEVFIPMWGHIAGAGLTSKYDNNKKFTYLY